MQTSFFEEPTFEEPDALPVIDRSTAERWAVCPAQAYMVERRQVTNGGAPADSGQAVHDIIGKAIAARVNDGMQLHDLYELVKDAAAKSRPDIQPDVIAAVRNVYPMLEHVCRHPAGNERAPDDILAFDGGTAERCGQLATDFALDDDTNVRITGEVDLLMATPSPQEVSLDDWKSGYKHWTASDVQSSFQFQWYALLAMSKFPDVDRVSVRIWMPRKGAATSPVYFERQHQYQIGERIRHALNLRRRHIDAADAGDVPAWPQPERCGLCSAATYCPRAHKPESDFASDPEAYLRDYAATVAKADRMFDVLTVAVRKSGGDLHFGDVAFGNGKPKAARAQPCTLYTPVKASDE